MGLIVMFCLIVVNSTRARVQSPVSVIFIFEISNPGWPISMARENIRVRLTRWEWLQYNFGRRRVAQVVRKIVKSGGPSGTGNSTERAGCGGPVLANKMQGSW
jgi:hypothetical protein